jgi:ParB-like chromosome segregation protein Spo0J
MLTNPRTLDLSEVLALPAHPVADLFPMYPAGDKEHDNKVDITLNDLSLSIEASGVREPIVLFGGTVLDGRNRRAGAQLAGALVVPVIDFEGTEEEAEQYILDLNIDRRNLTAGQRALVAVGYHALEAKKAEARRLANLAQNAERTEVSTVEEGRTSEILAKRFRVGRESVEKALKLTRLATAGPDEATKQGWAEHASYLGNGITAVTPIDFEEGDFWPQAQAAQAQLAQVRSGKISLNAAVTALAPKQDDNKITTTTKVRDAAGREIERTVTYGRERTLMEVLESALNRLVDAKELGPKFAAGASEEELAAAQRLTAKLVRVATELDGSL